MPIPVQAENIQTVLDDLTHKGASDIQLKTGHRPLAYIHGDWLPQLEYDAIHGDGVEAIHQVLCKDGRYRAVQDGPFDGDYRTSSLQNHFRVSAGRESGRMFLSLRPLPKDIPALHDLHLLDDVIGEPPPGFGALTAGFDYVLRQRRGLILVTGPTGSGKSTTLASFVNHLNHSRHYNIITIEDPIEFAFKSAKSQILQREVGVDTDSFGSALRAALRQKPDVILVGEMRDRPTIEAACRAAATGHLVMSTMHNNEAPAAIERIVNEFPAGEQVRVRHMLSEVLLGVFAQELVPTVAGGRQVIHESMVLTPELRASIRPKAGENNGGDYLQNIRDNMRTKNQYGSRLLDSELRRAVDYGLIEESVAFEYCIQKDQWGK